MVEIGELSEYEVAAILRGLRNDNVCINSAEREMVRRLCLKLERVSPTLDTIRRMRRHKNEGINATNGMRL